MTSDERDTRDRETSHPRPGPEPADTRRHAVAPARTTATTGKIGPGPPLAGPLAAVYITINGRQDIGHHVNEDDLGRKMKDEG